MKPSDGWSTPVCLNHHTEIHRIGARTFELTYGIDLRHVAAEFAAASPYLPHD